MPARHRVSRFTAAALALLVLSACGPVVETLAAEPGASVEQGVLDDARYRIEVPAHWNRVLLIYSHGYATPGSRPVLPDAPSRPVAAWLVGHGYALAGSSYSRQGWAVEQALSDQMTLLDHFSKEHPGPRTTLLWGSSMGGLVTETLAERRPSRVSGALAMCGPLAGGVAEWNVRLDAAFAFKTLLAPGSALRLTGIADPLANTRLARRLLAEAQATPGGRARLALASSVGGLAGWAPGQPAAPPTPDLLEQMQYRQWAVSDVAFFFARRAELESRAGGNPSWNTGVDYGLALRRSGLEPTVRQLYAEAGLALDQDLARLAHAPRIAARPSAVSYLATYAAPRGRLGVPLLTMHTTGDGLVPAAEETALAATVTGAGRGGRLRQVFVARGGHCTFTPAEEIEAVQTLRQRVDGGRWPATSPTALNTDAGTLGLGDAAFTNSRPGPFSRPFVPK